MEVSTHTDDQGNPSWMRQAATACYSVGLAIAITEQAIHGIFNRPIDINSVALSALILGVATTGKVAQKFAEK